MVGSSVNGRMPSVEELSGDRLLLTLDRNQWALSYGLWPADYSLLPADMGAPSGVVHQRCGMVSGMIQAVPRGWWPAELDLFDRHIAPGWGPEDYELCLRAWRLGGECLVVPDTVAYSPPSMGGKYVAAAEFAKQMVMLSAMYFPPWVTAKVIEQYIRWYGAEIVCGAAAAVMSDELIPLRRARLRQMSNGNEGGGDHLEGLLPLLDEFGWLVWAEG